MILTIVYNYAQRLFAVCFAFNDANLVKKPDFLCWFE